jgi:hypothetical protein
MQNKNRRLYISIFCNLKGAMPVRKATFAKFPKPATSRKSCGHSGETTSKAVPRS